MLYISGALFSLAIPNCHPEVYTYGCVCVERLLEVVINQRARFWAFGFSAVGDFKTQGIQFAKPQNILVMVAGGIGLYSMVMPNWGGAGHQNSAVSVQVESDFFCAIPGLAGT